MDAVAEARLMALLGEASRLADRLELILDEDAAYPGDRRVDLARRALKDFREAVEHHLHPGQGLT